MKALLSAQATGFLGHQLGEDLFLDRANNRIRPNKAVHMGGVVIHRRQPENALPGNGEQAQFVRVTSKFDFAADNNMN